MDFWQVITACTTGLTFVGTAWNAFQHRGVMLMMSEMRYNMMKEMNGKYCPILSYNDLKDRVKRLEESEDASKHS